MAGPGQSFIRIITLEGERVIEAASELTKSKSNVLA